jgi:hypothetical protein
LRPRQTPWKSLAEGTSRWGCQFQKGLSCADRCRSMKSGQFYEDLKARTRIHFLAVSRAVTLCSTLSDRCTDSCAPPFLRKSSDAAILATHGSRGLVRQDTTDGKSSRRMKA